jgi:hypothetical protein
LAPFDSAENLGILRRFRGGLFYLWSYTDICGVIYLGTPLREFLRNFSSAGEAGSPGAFMQLFQKYISWEALYKSPQRTAEIYLQMTEKSNASNPNTNIY